MRDWAKKKYWVVGASEGLGRAVAHQLSRAGTELFLSARSEDRLTALAGELPGRAHAVPMDVTDDASVDAAAERVGEIDGMIFLAGVYWPMKAQDWDAGKVVTMFEVNTTGAARVLGRVVPPMVARDKGHIVLTGSLSGFRGLPGAIGYAASKSGVMALAECMHADLKDTGVEVQLVNPGFVKTRLTDKNDFKMPMIMEPEAAAREIFEHMSGDEFARSFPRTLAGVFRGGNFLPDWAYYRLFS